MAHRGRSRGMDMDWHALGDVENGQDLAQPASLGTTAFLFASAGTLLRFRGKVGVILDTSAVGESAIIMCGLCVLPEDAVAAGAAPDFQADSGHDQIRWVWQGSLYVNSGAEAAIVTDALSAEVEIDSKSMIRVKPTHSLVFVHQAPAELVADQGGTYDIGWYVHVLTGQ